MMRMAVSVGRDQLGSVGVCFGKFTKTGKFKLHITALDHLAQYAKVIRKRIKKKVCKMLILLNFSTRFGSSLMVRCPFCMATIS